MPRFAVAVLAALWYAFAWAAPSSEQARHHLEDFDALWRAIDDGYAYFEGSHDGWKRTRAAWRAKAAKAQTRDEFIAVLENTIAALADDHVSLSERSRRAGRFVPAESDLWAQWKDGAAVITAVRPFSEADVAGVHPGQTVTQVDGLSVERLARARLRALGLAGPRAMDWALRRILAGPRQGSVSLTLHDAKGVSTVEIERRPNGAASGPPIIARRMGEDRDIGYLRIRNTLASPQLPVQFAAALGYLKDTRALIFDLRETYDSGARSVTSAILAHFVERESAWQVRESARSARTVDSVAPDGDAYRAPLIVLVDRWTAGEGEALAAGLQAAARATVIGTATAGLRGSLGEAKLPHSGIVVRFPTERTFDVNGAPREALRPAIEVDLAAPSGGPGDPILYQALKRAGASPSPAPAYRSDRR